MLRNDVFIAHYLQRWILNKKSRNMGKGLGSAGGVAAFCEFLKYRADQRYWNGKEWDLAIYLIDGSVSFLVRCKVHLQYSCTADHVSFDFFRPAEGNSLSSAPGIVRSIGGVCNWKQAYNCGIVKGQTRYKTVAFDRLLAHEVGHL